MNNIIKSIEIISKTMSKMLRIPEEDPEDPTKQFFYILRTMTELFQEAYTMGWERAKEEEKAKQN